MAFINIPFSQCFLLKPMLIQTINVFGRHIYATKTKLTLNSSDRFCHSASLQLLSPCVQERITFFTHRTMCSSYLGDRASKIVTCWAALARMALITRRLRALGEGRTRASRYSPLFTLIASQLRTKRITRRYREWRQQRA